MKSKEISLSPCFFYHYFLFFIIGNISTKHPQLFITVQNLISPPFPYLSQIYTSALFVVFLDIQNNFFQQSKKDYSNEKSYHTYTFFSSPLSFLFKLPVPICVDFLNGTCKQSISYFTSVFLFISSSLFA